MKQRHFVPPDSVTTQQLRSPVNWGITAVKCSNGISSKDHTEDRQQQQQQKTTTMKLMTPPLEILNAAFETVNPSEIAYVIVVNKNKRNSTTNIMETAPTPKPKFKLTIDEDLPGDIECLEQENKSAMEKKHSIIIKPDETETTIDETCFSVSSSVDDDDVEIKEVFGTATESGKENTDKRELIMAKLNESNKLGEKIELQLRSNGMKAVTLDDISYTDCQVKIEELAQQMQHENPETSKYYQLEQEMEKYNTAIMVTDEWQTKQVNAEKRWEEDNRAANHAALIAVRRNMPVNVRRLTTSELMKPNTATTVSSISKKSKVKGVPEILVKRFKRTNVLTLIRVDPIQISRMHPSVLENMRVTGLTITERRALHAHLHTIGETIWLDGAKTDSSTGRKYKWYEMMKQNFKESLTTYQDHLVKHSDGIDIEHHKCPNVGRSCPVLANKSVCYDNDLGYPTTDEYESSLDGPSATTHKLKPVCNNTSSGSNIKTIAASTSSTPTHDDARQTRAASRQKQIKSHYKRKIVEVAKAKACCESMEDLMDSIEDSMGRWVRQDIGNKSGSTATRKVQAEFTALLNEIKLASIEFAERSGLQVRGKRSIPSRHTSSSTNVESTTTPDRRSISEASLGEELYEYVFTTCQYMEQILTALGANNTKGNRLATLMSSVLSVYDDFEDRNTELLEDRIANDSNDNNEAVVQRRPTLNIEKMKAIKM